MLLVLSAFTDWNVYAFNRLLKLGLLQPGSAYQQMLLQQANGAMYLSPQPNQQAAAAAAATAAAVQYSALQSHLAAHQNAAAATFATLQHHQQYQQASLTGTPSPLPSMSFSPLLWNCAFLT